MSQITRLGSGSSSGPITTITGNAGTIVSPTGGNINILGSAPITTTGGGSTLTLTVASASTTQEGVVELATDAESIAGTDTTRAIVPSSLLAKLGPLTNHGVLVGGGGAAAVTALTAGTNGQLVIGSTGADPVVANITAGAGISITNGAGSITIAAIDPVFAWTEVTSGTVPLVANNGYILNNAGVLVGTLPVTAAVGTIIDIVGKGAGGWAISQNAGQSINILSSTTTVGVGGSLASTQRYNCITLICTVADTQWTVKSSMGNITVV